MRKLNQGEINLLCEQKYEQFTEKELTELSLGTASFKTYSRADKVMDRIKKHFQMPPSRAELLQGYVQKKDFDGFVLNHYNKLAGLVDTALTLLERQGLITKEMVEQFMEEKKAANKA